MSTGGVLGSAAQNINNTSTQANNTTQITGTTIQIVSPDPTKAGDAVEKKFEQMNRQATRNGQTAVAL